ncbi:MAG: hypothetical protein IKE28_12345 [Solobacterium sp.]|nr:hypothetical protein [Solobacterium sp.]
MENKVIKNTKTNKTTAAPAGFNQKEFNANKDFFSCCYSGIQFYYPTQSTR